MDLNEIAAQFAGDVTPGEIEAWLGQFEASHRPAIQRLLSSFRYYSFEQVSDLTHRLHKNLTPLLPSCFDKALIVPVGSVSTIGSAVAYLFRHQKSIPHKRFTTLKRLSEWFPEDVDCVVFLDYFIGSGSHGAALWHNKELRLSETAAHTKFVFAALVGHEAGIKHIEENTPFLVAVGEKIAAYEQPFNTSSTFFKTDLERRTAKDIVQLYGSIAQPTHPLGASQTSALVGFFFTTPDNTLPIFWGKENGWHPLLPQGEALRDEPAPLDASSVQPISPAAEERSREGRSVEELIDLERFDLDGGAVQTILEEFKTLRALLRLRPAMASLQIPLAAIQRGLTCVQRLKHATHENRAVASAILVIPSNQTKGLVKKVFSRLKAGSKLEDLDNDGIAIVDGLTGAALVRADGRFIGHILYPVAKEVRSLLPSRYHSAVEASRRTAGLLLLFCGEGHVHVYYSGARILSHRLANWHVDPHPEELEGRIFELAAAAGASPQVVTAILRAAFYLADNGNGALFTLGAEQEVQALAVGASSPLQFSALRVQEIDPRLTAALARQDGATVVRADGTIVRVGALLYPSASTEAHPPEGTGARHRTGAAISAVTKAVSIVVSVDGPISLFEGGRQRFRMMG